MPLYEYKCEACHHRFEKIQKFSDPPLEQCPKCGGRLRKLQSAPAFQFKGSGWYITDYAKKGQASAGKEEGGSTEATSAGKETAKGGETDGGAKTSKTDTSAASPPASSTSTSTKKDS